MTMFTRRHHTRMRMRLQRQKSQLHTGDFFRHFTTRGIPRGEMMRFLANFFYAHRIIILITIEYFWLVEAKHTCRQLKSKRSRGGAGTAPPIIADSNCAFRILNTKGASKKREVGAPKARR